MVRIILSILFLSLCILTQAQKPDLQNLFKFPPESAKPWVFWYWYQGCVSQKGITTDLEAMKKAGIGGAYLMTIKGPANPPLMNPPVEQLSPEWWNMVRFAFREADRLGLKLAMHDCDGFATAGGPWITPELSMQKLVWSETQVSGGILFKDTLTKPNSYKGYYKDIAVFAFPSHDYYKKRNDEIPKVTSSKTGINVQFLADKTNNETFKSDTFCWIQFAYKQPFTCRSITIRTRNSNYQSQRLIIETSDDGTSFRQVCRLKPPRHGWQDYDEDMTYSITPVTAKYFRFVFDKTGSEPGSEDLDAAKWKPVLRLTGIHLSGKPIINQFEGKTGLVWRISERTTSQQVPDSLCVNLKSLIDITKYLDSSGLLTWQIPEGDWNILRIGHTSTGHTNATGGKASGLECDKFNPGAIKIQFDNWFAEAFRQVGPETASKILKIFHVDSWECGSQNWSPVFREEFRKRRGYDMYAYLPIMTGVPLQSSEFSECFLSDVRQTIAELISDNFFGTLSKAAHDKGCIFSAESVAPTMLSDGMMHYKATDIPMGEFWINSPTHDKPNDIFDAVSGAYIYGKKIVQAEAFTELRMNLREYPGMLKTLADRNYAFGVNRFVFHVFMHNPWPERKPGIALDGVGLFFQPNQTWWEPGKAFIYYTQRCQALLQQGKQVADIAVFAGGEIPSRAVLPNRLVRTLPGIFGKEAVEKEEKRLTNNGEPLAESPEGVNHSANIAEPIDWTDPLRGYTYFSINKDVLLNYARVKDGKLILPDGKSFKMLVIPGANPMSPDTGLISTEVLTRLLALVNDGLTVIMEDKPRQESGIADLQNKNLYQKTLDKLWNGKPIELVANQSEKTSVYSIGKGKLVKGPWNYDSFKCLGIEKDLIISDSIGNLAKKIAWTHRRGEGYEIYFISNQLKESRLINMEFRVEGYVPEIYNPVNGDVFQANSFSIKNGCTAMPLMLEPNGSVFIIFNKKSDLKSKSGDLNWNDYKIAQCLNDKWIARFNSIMGDSIGPLIFNNLADWSLSEDSSIRYFSGTANYQTSFNRNELTSNQRIWLNLGDVANIAEVNLNGIDCGISWTEPFRVEITKAIKPGLNQLSVKVINTWANRLIREFMLPEEKRVTWTNAPNRLKGKPLQKSGLLGPVCIEVSNELISD